MEKLGRGDAIVIVDVAADTNDVSPAVLSPRARLDGHLRRDVTRLVPHLAGLIEGVGIDDRLGHAVVDIGDDLGLDVRQQVS